ncbi:MAG TPA: acyl-CoA dehydrogenase family protein [Amycolatopsis sp.]|nr:acyl-CoA dehydrogenase family protein [Amycolatopsis sp.]
MNVELSPDQELFAKTTRRFLEGQDLPAYARRLHEQGSSFERDYWQRGAELGWTAMLVPEALGGGSISGHGLLDLALVAEEMGRLVAPGPLLAANVVAEALSRGGGHEAVIGRLLTGEATATWAFDEGAGTWDAAGVRLRARPDGDGWVLDGTKAFVLDAPSADWFLVTARTSGGLTQFLVPATAEGVTVTARTSLDLVRRLGDVTFAGVPAVVVGAVDEAAEDVERQLRTALVLQNAETVGALDRVFGRTLAYAGDRVAFGRPIGSYQALKHRFADLKTALEACHATADASARAVAEGQPAAAELVSVAKSYLADHGPRMVQDCVQIHGGIGVTWEHDLHLYLRRVTQNAVLFGDVRQHRERLAAMAGM